MQKSKPQIIVHRDLYVLLGAQIALGRLDRGVAEEEFDLLQIPPFFLHSLAQLGAPVSSSSSVLIVASADLFAGHFASHDDASCAV